MSLFTKNSGVLNYTTETYTIAERASPSFILRGSNKGLEPDRLEVTLERRGVIPEDIAFPTYTGQYPVDRHINEQFKERVMAIINGHRFRNEPADIVIRIDLKPFIDSSHDRCVTSEILGCTIYKGDSVKNARYQNSQEVRTEQNLKETFGILGYRSCIYLTDRQNVMAPLYFNAMGKAERICSESFKDLDQNSCYEIRDGLYITRGDNKESLETESYTLEQLKDPKVLESLGIYTSREECEAAGNTDRYITAEKSLKEKEKQLSEARDKIKKAEKDIEALNKQLETAKEDHKHEIRVLKDELRTAKSEAKRSADKAEMRLEQSKNKGELGSWTEAFKSVSNVISGFMGFGRLFN